MDTTDLKVYKMIIEDESVDGITNMSFVESPAVAIDFLRFNNESNPIALQFENEEQRIVTGVAMLANVPIFRKANNVIKEDHYVVFDADNIKSIIHKFFKNKLTANVNLNHKTSIEGAYLFESYIVNSQLGINAPNQLKDIPDGSWITSYKIENNIVWEMVKQNKFNGFSIEGYFGYDIDINTNTEHSNKNSENSDVTETIENANDWEKIHKILSTII